MTVPVDRADPLDLALIVDQIPAGVVVTDLQGSIIVFNRASVDLLHGEAEDVPGRNIASLFPPEDYRQIAAVLSDSGPGQASASLRNCEREMLTVGGNPVPVNLSATPIRSREGRAAGHLFLIQDLRDAAVLEAQTTHEGNRSTLGEIAFGISHEINSRLGIIKGSLAFLKVSLQGRDQMVDKHLSIMEQAVTRGTGFLRDSLEFAAGARLQLSRLDPLDLVRQVKESVGLRASWPSLRFRVEDSGPVPAIQGDFRQLHKILLDLFDHLVEATGFEGEFVLSVRPDIARDLDLHPPRGKPRRRDPARRTWALFESDTGVPVEKLPAMVRAGDPLVVVELVNRPARQPSRDASLRSDPFQPGSHKKGKGLAFALSQSILKRHHASVQVDLDPEEVTRVTIKFPIFENVVQFEKVE